MATRSFSQALAVSAVSAMLLVSLPVGGDAEGGRMPTTTVIVHGYSPDEKGAWVEGLAGAIIGRTGGVGSVYRYTDASGAWKLVPGADGDGSSQHVVLIFNWVPESDGPDAGPNWNYAQAAGDALYAMLRDPAYDSSAAGPDDLVGALESPRAVHFIGHSRGACVISEAIRRLALAGIPVDQMTTHDPHPVNGTLDARYDFDWGDPVPVRWSNVAWADNYWRADGGGLFSGLDFDGIPLEHVYNTHLIESALNCCAYFFAHSDVHLWYHGTVDLSPTPSDGEQTTTAQMRATWWPEGYSQKGFFYSAIGGGAAQRPALGAGVLAPIGSAPIIYNGAFEQGSHAGWSHHGGTAGSIIEGGSNWFARLGSSNPLLVHNRAFLTGQPLAISVRVRRVGTTPSDDIVRVAIQREDDPQPVMLPLAAWPVSALSMSFESVAASIPSEFLGRTARLSIVLDGASEGINATIDIDDIAVEIEAALGDLNGDGFVNGADLAILLGSWGPCAGCPADINGDGVVDGADIAIVLGNWTV